MSRWSNWTRGLEDKPRFLSNFIKEAQMDMGNPSAGSSPAERARQLGLQSDGSGSYIDPETGQTIARTVNGELVFYDNRGQGGGAVTDGAGGKDLANAQPSWSDPMTGMAITPPSRPESPEEQQAIPDPIPATAPAGYDSFMNQSRMRMHQQSQQSNATADVNNPMQAAPNPGIQPIGPDGKVPMGPDVSGMEESVGDNSSMRSVSGDVPKPGKTFHDMRKELGKLAAKQYRRQVDEKQPKKDTVQSLLRKRFKPLTQGLKGMEEGDTRDQFMGSVLNSFQYGDYNNNKTQLMSGPEVRGAAGRVNAIRDGYQEDENGRFDIDKASEFVQGTRHLKGQIPQEIKDKAFAALPDRIRDRFTGGDIKKSAAGKREGFDMFCDQGGKCGYTGMPLDLESFAVEHFVDNSRVQNGEASPEEAEFINDPQRAQFWANKAPNAQKSARTPSEFADIIEKLNQYDDDYFDFQDNQVVPAKGSLRNDELGLIGQGLIQDGQLMEGIDDDKISAIKDLVEGIYSGEKTNLLSQLEEKYDPRGFRSIGDKAAQKMLESGEMSETDMEIRSLVRGLQDQIKGLNSSFGNRAIKSLGLSRGFRQSLRPRTSGIGHDSIYEGFLRTLAHADPERRKELIEKWGEATSSSGRLATDLAESGQKGLKDSDVSKVGRDEFRRLASEYGLFDEQSIGTFPLLKKFIDGDDSISEEYGQMLDENPMDMILQILQKIQELTSEQ